MLSELRNILGSNEKGWRVTMRVPNQKGEFGKITEAIYSNGWGLMAMGSVRSPGQPNHWDAVVKIGRCEEKQIILDVLEATEGHQIVDIRKS